MKNDISEKRNLFLSELRSGKWKKGCIKSDEKTGRPIFENEEDFVENTACSCAIMGNLFGQQKNGKISLPKATKALGLKSTDCKFIQQEINDRKSTLEEDAEIIETIFFNNEKYNKVSANIEKRINEITNIDPNTLTPEIQVAPPVERILIKKIIYDFKLSGKTIRI